MPLLKLNASRTTSQDGVPQASPPPPTPASATGGGPKLKLSFSQPPTPATEHPPASASAFDSAPQKKTQRKNTSDATKGKKRAAKDDISPAAKRTQGQTVKRPSLSLRAPSAATTTAPAAGQIQTPLTAGGVHKIKLGKRKPSIQPRVTIDVKRKVPPRQHAVGYDSEDSDTERDPAIQNGFVLRMQPGEDADYLRDAITNGKMGVPIAEGGAQVTLKFLGKDQRRAVVRIKTRMYAAVLVDLPCIIESMKSWDKKGWWKVADICQMLLVLGLVNNEEEAETYALPREVDKNTLQYAHGLTPPMHWVRKRRFRKRVTQKHTDDVDARVREMLEADEECERAGGSVTPNVVSREQWERRRYEDSRQSEQPYDDEMDAEGEAVETTEGFNDYYDEAEEDQDDDDDDDESGAVEAQLMDMFEQQDNEAPAIRDMVTDSPVNMADQAASFAAVENAMMVESPAQITSPAEAPTPVQTEAAARPDEDSDEDESDEDEDEESDADEVDEDAAARAAEKAQQLAEVADLEREIEIARQRVMNQKNRMLRDREVAKMSKLEDSLRIKRDAFGLNAEE